MMESKKDFINYLEKSLIPYLIDIEKVSTARDFQEAIHWMLEDESKDKRLELGYLTEKERMLMVVIVNDDTVSDYGWQSSDACFWTNDMLHADSSDLNVRAVPGLLGSLSKKNMIATNGESGNLTDLGRQWLIANQDKLNI